MQKAIYVDLANAIQCELLLIAAGYCLYKAIFEMDLGYYIFSPFFVVTSIVMLVDLLKNAKIVKKKKEES